MSCISFKNLCPSSGDTENVLLAKILASINAGGGGGGAGVSSIAINGSPPQTGAVAFSYPQNTDELPEGATNLYFTEARVRATVLTGFASALGAITAADSVLGAFGKTQGRLAALEAGTSGPYLLKAGDTGTGPFVFTPSAANTTPLTLSGASLTGASAIPFLSIAGTWNTTGAPTGLFFNATNTASDSASKLFDFQLDAASKFSLRVDGLLALAGRTSFVTTSALGHVLQASDALNTATSLVATLGHTLSAGVGAAGMGTTLDWTIDSTTTASTRAARWSTYWTTATHATRTSVSEFFNYNAGSEVTQMILGNNQIAGNPGTAALPSFTNRNDTDNGLWFPTTNTNALSCGGVQTFTIDSALGVWAYGAGDTAGFVQSFRKARGTVAAPSAITSGDTLGSILFRGYSGAAGYVTGASIRAVSSGTIATTRVASSLVFATGTDAAPTVLTDALTINNAGRLMALPGSAAAPEYSFAGTTSGMFFSSVLKFSHVGTDVLSIGTSNYVQLASAGVLAWSSTSDSWGATALQLQKDASDVLAQRRGTNPQTFRVYNTFTDASNNEFLTHRWNTNVAEIGTVKNGTGTARALSFLTDGTGRFSIGATGTVTCRPNTAIPAGGTQNVGLCLSSTASFGVFFGSGAPTLTAAKGSLYLRSDGSGTTDRAYINTDGSTAWTALTTVA